METIGDYIRFERVKRGLEQKEVAELIGVSEATVSNWERHRGEPHLRYIPSVVSFLGYDPFSVVKGDNLIAWVKHYQRRTGHGLNVIAQKVGMDSGYLSHVMRGKFVLGKEKRERLLVIIGHE